MTFTVIVFDRYNILNSEVHRGVDADSPVSAIVSLMEEEARRGIEEAISSKNGLHGFDDEEQSFLVFEEGPSQESLALAYRGVRQGTVYEDTDTHELIKIVLYELLTPEARRAAHTL